MEKVWNNRMYYMIGIILFTLLCGGLLMELYLPNATGLTLPPNQGIYLDDQLTGSIGKNILFTLRLEKSPNPIEAFGLIITFDPDILRPQMDPNDSKQERVMFTRGTLLQDPNWNFINISYKKGNNYIKIGGFSASKHILQNESGSIAFIHFIIQKSFGRTYLSISNLVDDIEDWASYNGSLYDYCYFDSDEDGHGDHLNSIECVVPPDGYVLKSDDCDDTDSNVYPGNQETHCNGKDDDCDPLTIDDDVNADGDPVSLCHGDCNDNDSSIYPGAKEQCDGKDNDCNGSVPSNEADADNDWFRICSGDCDDTNPNTYPVALERADNKDNDCDGMIDESNIIVIRQDSNLKQWLAIHKAPTATKPDIGPAIASYATQVGNAKATSAWAVFAVVAGDFDADGIHEIAVLFQNNTAPYGQYLNIYEAPQAVGDPLSVPKASFKFIGAIGTFNNVNSAVAGNFIPGHPGDEIGLIKENAATGGQRIVFYAPPTQLNETLPLEPNALATYKWIGNRFGLMIISASSGDYNNDGSTEIGFVYQNQNPISPWKGTQLLQVYTSPTSGYSGALPPGSLIASVSYIGMQNTVSSILGTCGGNFVQTNAADEFMFMRKNAQGVGNLRIVRPPQTLNATLPAPLAADYDIGTEVTLISGIR